MTKVEPITNESVKSEEALLLSPTPIDRILPFTLFLIYSLHNIITSRRKESTVKRVAGFTNRRSTMIF